ncbi:hypothetical protein [Pseudoprimorskyibacter insulae]|uniref:Uncharacterized protein n=1 Tax=Pseudoprimorskyibacter insulae TaxID=1695997 RepID=A0A2R8AVP4_9RHOB|nr:hypothetical protein [Pseudoprimorskyibacter insulae]SPF80095.1 hypothetical protein PRI8871_01897 [Pseudoprimorskyibacter insulae]
MIRMTDAHVTDAQATLLQERERCQAEAPFACLKLGGASFEIAYEKVDDPDETPPTLAFSISGRSGWIRLNRSVADGWTRIGADILMRDGRVLDRFLNTHAVRISGDYNLNEEVRFDTLGTYWSARIVSDTGTEIRVDGEPWMLIEQSNPPASPKDRVIRALAASHPEIREYFAQHIDHWACRIATGVTVLPMM